MKVLGIETSTYAGSVALVEEGRVLGELYVDVRPAHAAKLAPMTAALLEMVEVDKSELDGVAVDAGPGYYTALRVGVSAAKTLAYALGVPVVGVSSLAALAANVPFVERPVCAVLDAKRSQLYWALFGSGGLGAPRLSEDAVGGVADVVRSIPEGALVVGDVSVVARQVGRGGGPPPGELVFAEGPHNVPRASVCALIGSGKLLGRGADEVASLRPAYLREFGGEAL